MPLAQCKTSLLPLKRKADDTAGKEPKEAKEPKKAPAKASTIVGSAEPNPKGLMKGRVAEVHTSSLHPIIYKQLTLPEMVPGLEHFSKPRKVGFLERSRIAVPEVLKKRWCRSPVKDGEVFQPKLNVLDDESLLLDCPLEGGNLGYRILKAMQLKYDLPVDEVQTIAAVHAHNLAVVSISSVALFTSIVSVLSFDL